MHVKFSAEIDKVKILPLRY